MKNEKSINYYIPVVPITLLLLVLKLAGVISISWFWVFFPLWIFPVILVGFLGLVIVFGMIAMLIVGFLS